MGIFDKAKDLVGKHGDKVDEGLEKAGDVADEKTGGKNSEQIDQGVQKAQDAVDGLGRGQEDNPA
jgi:hypothetical protein